MLIPPYLVTVSIVVIIFPTVIASFVRTCLYRHLKFLERYSRRLLTGEKPPQLPRLISNLEQRLEDSGSHIDKINTLALLYSAYTQERFRFLVFQLPCEGVDYFCRVLPLLILAFGLIMPGVLIVVNLNYLQTIILSLNLNDLRSLVENLQQPLKEIGIIFLIALVALICSSLLFLINLIWNTKPTKSNLIYCLADYLDNIYLPNYNSYNPLEETIERLVLSLTVSLEHLGENLEKSLANNLGQPLQKISDDNVKIITLSEELSVFLKQGIKLIENLEQSAKNFDNSVKVFEQSRFADKLNSATADLAIALSQYSQSSLMLNKSTQSLEYTLDSLQKFLSKMMELNSQMSSLNDKYVNIVNLAQKRNVIEEAGLNQIKNELTHLVEKLKK